jgi:hypothetical protein
VKRKWNGATWRPLVADGGVLAAGSPDLPSSSPLRLPLWDPAHHSARIALAAVNYAQGARREGFLKAGDQVNPAGWIKAICHRAALDPPLKTGLNVPGMSQAPEGGTEVC